MLNMRARLRVSAHNPASKHSTTRATSGNKISLGQTRTIHYRPLLPATPSVGDWTALTLSDVFCAAHLLLHLLMLIYLWSPLVPVTGPRTFSGRSQLGKRFERTIRSTSAAA